MRNQLSVSARLVVLGAVASLLDTSHKQRAEEVTSLTLELLSSPFVDVGKVTETIESLTGEMVGECKKRRISPADVKACVSAAFAAHHMPEPEQGGMPVNSVRYVADKS